MFAKENSRFATMAAVATLVVVLAFSVTRTAAQETILLNYNGKNGAGPAVTMVADKAGNFYGTTNYGGAFPSACNGMGCGTVFELVNRDGKYTHKIIHSFGNGTDGQNPNAQLIVRTATCMATRIRVERKALAPSSGCTVTGPVVGRKK